MRNAISNLEFIEISGQQTLALPLSNVLYCLMKSYISCGVILYFAVKFNFRFEEILLL
jgi:hypothetical protein